MFCRNTKECKEIAGEFFVKHNMEGSKKSLLLVSGQECVNGEREKGSDVV